MKCTWDELLSVLPPRMRMAVDKYGREEAEELRLRLHRPAELVLHRTVQSLKFITTAEDVQFVVNAASRYSPWAASTVSKGYITAPGGHRIGLCGECVVKDGVVSGIRTATSLCIRVARDFSGIGQGLPQCGSLLILGPPGAGKTTLLRDYIRIRAATEPIAVVDERGELFPQSFTQGEKADVLTGCSKMQGIEMALRTMGPKCIAVDEITAYEDCQALLKAGWCGVDLLATAHAGSITDLKNRPVYCPLLEGGLFDRVAVLGKDKCWHMERMGICT